MRNRAQFFDPGYRDQPYRELCENYPRDPVYPLSDFRVEWGPIFHRGRLDGSARVLVIGQDPAAHETIARRILVGKAGHRVQGFLGKLGIHRSYVMINVYLYSIYGDARKHSGNVEIARYRNRWLDALASERIEAVIALGTLAEGAWRSWKATPKGAAFNPAYCKIIHPTQPEASAKDSRAKFAAAIAGMLDNWNAALQQLKPAIEHSDTKCELKLYGKSFKPSELPKIPEFDLPAGLPRWMGGRSVWAVPNAVEDHPRFFITVIVPKPARKTPGLA